MGNFFQDTERRSYLRFPFSFPIHLMADSGQIIIGRTQNIGTNGLLVEISKNLQRDTFVMAKFSHEKTSVGGYGRVVWSKSDREKNFCGITFLKMKQKDKQTLNEILERIVSPVCPMCHSKLEIEKLIPYFEMQVSKERIDYKNASPLMEMAYLLNSNFPWEALMKKILEVMKNHFHGKAVELFLYNEDTGMLERRCHAGLRSTGTYLLNAEKIIDGEAFREGKIIFIPDVQKPHSFINKEEAKTAGIHSMIVLPLFADGKISGVLNLCNPSLDNREALKEGEKRLMSTFANLITIALKMST